MGLKSEDRILCLAPFTHLYGLFTLQLGLCVGASGRAMPGTEVRIAHADDGRVLTPGEIGELQVRGCSVFSGYAGNPAATAESFTADGWFRTGDLAEMDPDGNVRLHGRIKDIINRGGVKFNPAEVEAVIASHPAVAQVAVAPLPDPLLGERAACFVVLHDKGVLNFDELKHFLAEQKVAKFMWPEQLEIVPDMPTTPTRKIIKLELVQRLLACSDSTPCSLAATSDSCRPHRIFSGRA